jgi:hypothetical protein
VGESICRNQLIAAIQAIVNENPKDQSNERTVFTRM